MCKGAGKRIAFRSALKTWRTASFCSLNNRADSFVSGSYGILEPKPEDSTEVFAEDIDLIIVPAVAFTKEAEGWDQGADITHRLLKKTGAIHGRRRVRFPTLRKPSR